MSSPTSSTGSKEWSNSNLTAVSSGDLRLKSVFGSGLNGGWSGSTKSSEVFEKGVTGKSKKKSWFGRKAGKLMTLRTVVAAANVFIIIVTVLGITLTSYYVSQNATYQAVLILSGDAMLKTVSRIQNVILLVNLARNTLVTTYQFSSDFNLLDPITTSRVLQHSFLVQDSPDVYGLYAASLPNQIVYVGRISPIDSHGVRVAFVNFSSPIYGQRSVINSYVSVRNCSLSNTNCVVYNESLLFDASRFDLRIRPYYVMARVVGRSSWTSVYRFTGSGVLGFTAFTPIFGSDNNTLEMIAAADVTLAALAQSLQEFAFLLSSDPTTRIFLLDRVVSTEFQSVTLGSCPQSGLLLASSNLASITNLNATCLVQAVDSSDPVISFVSKSIVESLGPWETMNLSSDGNIAKLDIGGYIIYVEQFIEPDENIDWVVVVSVQKSVFLNQLDSLFVYVLPTVAVGIVFISVVLSLIFTHFITRPLKRISKQLLAVAELNFDVTKGIKDRTMEVREVAEINEALVAMTTGLRSFQRYVPQDVVRLLVKLKREAVLGADEVELTVRAIVDVIIGRVHSNHLL